MIDELWLIDKVDASLWIEIIDELVIFGMNDIIERLVALDFEDVSRTAEIQASIIRELGMEYYNALIEKTASLSKKLEKDVRELFQEAVKEEFQYDKKQFEDAGYEPIKKLSPRMQDILRSAYVQTNGELKNITRTTAIQSQQRFISDLDKVFYRVKSGQQSYSQAISDVVNDVASDGLYIGYPSGKMDTLEVATRRAVLTGVNQSTIRLQIAYAQEMEAQEPEYKQQYLVTQHYGARTKRAGRPNYEDHFSWQGKVYDLDGLTTVCGYGTGGGLGGWNCRHHIILWFPGMDIPEPLEADRNKEAEENAKKQRSMERAIRKTKRELIGLNTAIENTTNDQLKFNLQQDYDRKSLLLQHRNKKYNEFNTEKGLKKQYDRIQIAKWNRSEAAKASAAARREKAKR